MEPRDGYIERIFLGVVILAGILLLAYIIKPVLVALSISIVLVYLINPIVERIQSYVKRRRLAIALTFLFILLPFFLFFTELTTTVAAQLIELSSTPQATTAFKLLGESFTKYLEQFSVEFSPGLNISTFQTFGGILTQGLGSLINLLKTLSGLFLQGLFGIFLTLYLLFKKEAMLELFNSVDNDKTRRFILFVDEALKQVVYSIFLTALATGIIAILIYSAFGVPFAALWGTTTGIVSLIPFLGTWLVYLPIAIYLFIQGDSFLALVFLGACIVFISVLPDIAVRPVIAGRKIDPGLIAFGFVAGIMAFGAVGLILGPLVIIAWAGFVKIFLIEDKSSKPVDKSKE